MPWTVYTIKGILFYFSKLLFWWVDVHTCIKLTLQNKGYYGSWQVYKICFRVLEKLNFAEDSINNSELFYKWVTIIKIINLNQMYSLTF